MTSACYKYLVLQVPNYLYTVGEQKHLCLLERSYLCYYVILVTMLLNGHAVNSSVTCYTSSTFCNNIIL